MHQSLRITALGQWFSNLSKDQDLLEGLLKHRLQGSPSEFRIQ